MPKDITVTTTKEGAQYLLDAIDTHVKTHGLRVAPMGVMLLGQIQAAAGSMADEVVPAEPKEA
ncbi:hypothetical protein LCGC14_3037410 [marine sediment metagenome]|uniref:Uncharacterized protein n=1 Tax=marine sediment metagenome TaxID=412755 RepID=A0A0F8XDU3_9ZZZZ